MGKSTYYKYFNHLDKIIEKFNKKSPVKINDQSINFYINSMIEENDKKNPKTFMDTHDTLCDFLDIHYVPFFENFVKATKNGQIEDIGLLSEAQAIFTNIAYFAFAKDYDMPGQPSDAYDYYIRTAKEFQNNLTKDYVFDTEHYSIKNETLKEKDEKAQEVLMNYTEIVDYKADLIKNGNYHIETIKQNLIANPITKVKIKADSNLTEVTNDEDLRDYIKQYKLLEEKHNNRNFFSRLWHSSEKKLLADAKDKLAKIKDLDQFGNDHFNTWLINRLDPSRKMNGIQNTPDNTDRIYEDFKKQEQIYTNQLQAKETNEKIKDDKEKDLNVLKEFAKKAYKDIYHKEMDKNNLKELNNSHSHSKIRGFMKGLNINIARDSKGQYIVVDDKFLNNNINIEDIKIGKPETDKPLDINDEFFNTEKLDKKIEAANQENQDKAIEQDNQENQDKAIEQDNQLIQ